MAEIRLFMFVRDQRTVVALTAVPQYSTTCQPVAARVYPLVCLCVVQAGRTLAYITSIFYRPFGPTLLYCHTTKSEWFAIDIRPTVWERPLESLRGSASARSTDQLGKPIQTRVL